MSKKSETKTLWLTRERYSYEFWNVKPRKSADGSRDFYRRRSYSVCIEVFNRAFPKSWRLKPGGGPLECELRVKE